MNPQSEEISPVPLPNEPVIEDVNKATEQYIFRNEKFSIFIYGLLLVGLLAVILAYRLDIRLLTVPFFIIAIAYGHISAKIKREFTEQFGASIGFTYSPSAGMETVSGKIFRTGHSQAISDVLSGVHDNLPMRIFSFRFTVGSGKSSHTYFYTIFEARLNNPVPDILLFSSTHALAVSDWFSGDETIELEGDFNRYFRLRVPRGCEQEAYQIFTPDVMADLIDRARDYSFEFSGDRLYVVAAKVIGKREEMQAMFDLVTFMDNLFRRNARALDMTGQADLRSIGQ